MSKKKTTKTESADIEKIKVVRVSTTPYKSQIGIRVSVEEYNTLAKLANAEAASSMSNYCRSKLGLPSL